MGIHVVIDARIVKDYNETIMEFVVSFLEKRNV